MTQLVLQKSKLGLQNPIDMVYHAQPWMIVAVLPFAVLFEGMNSVNSKNQCALDNDHIVSFQLISILGTGQEILQQTLSLNTPEEWDAAFEIALKILVGALMAFFMEVGEYLVITFTSSLTFAVAGIFKVTIILLLSTAKSETELACI